jgi:hypothetical protein
MHCKLITLTQLPFGRDYTSICQGWQEIVQKRLSCPLRYPVTFNPAWNAPPQFKIDHEQKKSALRHAGRG